MPQDFPEIAFADFASVIQTEFNGAITLASVLTILFSVIRNPHLLSLHYRQRADRTAQKPAWGKHLARMIIERLDNQPPDQYLRISSDLLKDSTFPTIDAKIMKLTESLEHLIERMGLAPTRVHGGDYKEHYQSNILHEQDISPVTVLTSEKNYCVKCSANKIDSSLKVAPKNEEIPSITVIEGVKVIAGATVVAGKCERCKSIYYPDHDSYSDVNDATKRLKFFRPNCNFLKIGRNLWADRQFAQALTNGLYSFSSITSYAAYWTKSYWPSNIVGTLTRRNVWSCFIQHSIREMVNAIPRAAFLTPAKMSIKDTTKLAYQLLGQDGEIPGARDHECDECAQDYMAPQLAQIHNGAAAVLGVDNAGPAPVQGDQNADVVDAMGQAPTAPPPHRTTRTRAQPKVNMVVLDGIVMGHSVS